MLGDQFQFLAWFYVKPKKAASAVLDHGRFLFAALAAVLVTLAISIGADTARLRDYREFTLETRLAGQPPQDVVAAFEGVRRRVEQRYFASSLQTLVLMSVVFAPVCVLILAAWARLGGALTILFRDYMPVLAGLLFAWTAAQLPVAIAWWTFPPAAPAAIIALQIAGLAYFLFLAVPVLTTVTGVDTPLAAATALLGLLATAVASLLLVGSGSFLYLFASPWLLYYAYRTFGSDLQSLGGGLSARQNFKRQLEAATLNPHDADAHYQLGLIYTQRRAYADAEQSFRRALAIDPHEPETLFQLGRLLRLQGGHDVEARQLLERGAQLDPKLASHQVWRELGAVALASGSSAEALTHLGRYVNAREYDPEGLVLYGRALRSLQRPEEAKAAFQKAIEAVQTAPKFRRTELGPWEKQARQELRG